MISLFHEEPAARRGISSVFLSLLLHGGVIGMVAYGILHAPQIYERAISERYAVRHLDFHVPDSPAQYDGQGGTFYPGKDAGKGTLAEAMAGDPNSAPVPEMPQPPQSNQGAGGKQTLVQPEFRKPQRFASQAPLPTVVLWRPEQASKEQIVAPPPDTPPASPARPSLEAPNQEVNVADAAVAASAANPKLPMPDIGTTSPLVTNTLSPIKTSPATISLSPQQPTPTAVLSISDLRMNDGSVVLPPVNETRAKSSAAQQTAPVLPKGAGGRMLTGSLTTSGASPATAAGGQGSANAPGQTAQGTIQANGKADSNALDTQNTAHITLPRDGRFSVVVVGTSLSEEYPETLQIWNDRVAYTAFLHVGLPKNWILQYAELRSADAGNGGGGGRLEAPWPYDIFRPNLISNYMNAEALMIHGIVDQDGHFEKLAVAFPSEFDRASFVLHALQRWQFRPARQNGKATSVEVLLIIPDEFE